MANQKKTYFLCPTWDYHPDGPIQLGNIILSPSTPDEPLNPGAERVPPPADALFPPTSKTGAAWREERTHEGRYGLWTRFLASSSSALGLGLGVGLDAGAHHGAARAHALAFDRLDTAEFLPMPAYLAACVAAAPAVRAAVRRRGPRARLYMVTALKTARGARGASEARAERGVELGATLDGSAPALLAAAAAPPVALGPEVRGSWGRAEAVSFGGSSDFVFAFRLRRLVVRRSGEVVSHSQYTTGAMFDANGGGYRRGEDDPPFVVEGLAAEDASARDFGWEDVAEVVVDDADEEECVCVLPKPELPVSI